MSKETYYYGKRDLCFKKRGLILILTLEYLRDAQVSKETYYYGKTDLCLKKRGLILTLEYLRDAQVSKETYYYGKRDLCPKKRGLILTLEHLRHALKQQMSVYRYEQNRPICVVKRDLFSLLKLEYMKCVYVRKGLFPWTKQTYL